MIEGWRWFGPLDKISLQEVAQTGATAVVTALHEVPYGKVWSLEAIQARQAMIAQADVGLSWQVVESLPLHEDIKLGEARADIFANYRQSMVNLAKAGITTICYNFMPLLDWTRTTLDAPIRGGATALRFDATEMAAFELHMLGRAEAEGDYPSEVITKAGDWAKQADEATKDRLLASIMAGLPGAYDRYTVDTLREALKRYEGLDRAALRTNYATFLSEVIPTAADLGIRMAVHPDDPPRDILGLPRIVSDADDIAFVLGADDTRENGLTLCAGSLGANPKNDVPAIATRFADRIHFAHLRNVAKEPDGSFQEAAQICIDRRSADRDRYG